MKKYKISFKLNLFLVFGYCTVILAQSPLEKKTIQELDSLGLLNKKPDFTEYYYESDTWREILKKSKKTSAIKNELRSYAHLADFHGYDDSEKNLDSVTKYFNLFENTVSSLTTEQRRDSLIIQELSCYYLNKGDILNIGFGFEEPGLKAYFAAYPFIDKNNIDDLTKYNIGVSRIYKYKGQYDKALALILPCLKDTVAMDITIKLNLLEQISKVYSNKKMYHKSIEYSEVILEVLEEFEWCEYGQWRTRAKMAKSYRKLGDCKKALDLSLQVKDYYSKNPKNERGYFFICQQIGSIYYHMGDMDNALTYLKEAEANDSLNVNLNKSTYTKLAALYTKKKDYLRAMSIIQKKYDLVDKERKSEKAAFANYIEINTKYLKGQKENQSLIQKNKEQKLYVIVTTILLVSILSLIGIVYYFRKYKKSAKEIQILKKSERALLEEQIRLRDNELDATAIALSQRVEVLNVIKKELESIKVEDPKLNNINKTINNLIKSSSNIAVITDKIEFQHPKLTANLKDNYPNLSNTEIRYCLLTKLNLSVKETAIILGVARDTVKTSRSRLKKKMNVPKELSLKDFLDKIDV